jgi:hypothetical protein
MEPERSSTKTTRESERVATEPEETTELEAPNMRENSSGTLAVALTVMVLVIPGV